MAFLRMEKAKGRAVWKAQRRVAVGLCGSTSFDCMVHGIAPTHRSDCKTAQIFSFALARFLVLCFAMEPTCDVWVGGRLLDSSLCPRKKSVKGQEGNLDIKTDMPEVGIQEGF